MDIRWLQDFVVLAEMGNFTRAAAARNVSQAAFSRRIQSLEAWLGSPLVNRATVPVRLTAAGERFLDQAREISQLLSIARHEPLLALSERGEDLVRLAAPMAIATTHLARWLLDWDPNGELRLNISNHWVHESFSALAVGDLDILICYHAQAQPLQVDPELVESIQIGTERMVPMAGTGVMIERGWTFPGSRTRPLPILMYQHRAYLGRIVDSILAQAPEPIIGYPIVAGQMASVLAPMVANGVGVAWLPDRFLELSSGRLEALHGSGPWTAEMSIMAYRSRTPARFAVRKIWTEIRRASAAGPARAVPP